jgi:uncharacterized protein (TIGR00369 family)
MSDQRRLRALVESVTTRPGFTSSIGTRVVAVEVGKVQMALGRRPDLLQFSGHFHGGVIAALTDHAAGAAVTTALPEGRIAITINLHINYLAPAKGETLMATARTVMVGASVGVAQVDLDTVVDGSGHPCAVALVTLRAVDKKAATNPSSTGDDA